MRHAERQHDGGEQEGRPWQVAGLVLVHDGFDDEHRAEADIDPVHAVPVCVRGA